MDTISISDARANLKKLINEVSQESERIIISVNGKPKAVVLSFEELEALEETAEVLGIPNAEKSINKGLNEAAKRQGKTLSALQ